MERVILPTLCEHSLGCLASVHLGAQLLQMVFPLLHGPVLCWFFCWFFYRIWCSLRAAPFRLWLARVRERRRKPLRGHTRWCRVVRRVKQTQGNSQRHFVKSSGKHLAGVQTDWSMQDDACCGSFYVAVGAPTLRWVLLFAFAFSISCILCLSHDCRMASMSCCRLSSCQRLTCPAQCLFLPRGRNQGECLV